MNNKQKELDKFETKKRRSKRRNRHYQEKSEKRIFHRNSCKTKIEDVLKGIKDE